MERHGLHASRDSPLGPRIRPLAIFYDAQKVPRDFCINDHLSSEGTKCSFESKMQEGLHAAVREASGDSSAEEEESETKSKDVNGCDRARAIVNLQRARARVMSESTNLFEQVSFIIRHLISIQEPLLVRLQVWQDLRRPIRSS